MVERSGRSIDIVVVFVAGVILLAVIYGGYCDFLDGKYIFPVLEMGARSQQYTHETTKKIYRPGEMVYAHVLFHKNRNLIGTIQWHLINKSMRDFAPRVGSLPVGIWDKEVRVEVIPHDAEPGEHWFCGTVSYRPNWLGRVEYPIWSNKFEVIR